MVSIASRTSGGGGFAGRLGGRGGGKTVAVIGALANDTHSQCGGYTNFGAHVVTVLAAAREALPPGTTGVSETGSLLVNSYPSVLSVSSAHRAACVDRVQPASFHSRPTIASALHQSQIPIPEHKHVGTRQAVVSASLNPW